jgi:hypothetical protein
MIEEDDDIQQYVRPWVGLTDEEVDKIKIGFNSCWGPEPKTLPEPSKPS